MAGPATTPCTARWGTTGWSAAGGDVIYGGAGNDTVQLQGASSEYTFVQYGDWLEIGDRVANRDGLLKVSGVEGFYFKDSREALTLAGLPVITAQQYIDRYVDLMRAFNTRCCCRFRSLLEQRVRRTTADGGQSRYVPGGFRCAQVSCQQQRPDGGRAERMPTRHGITLSIAARMNWPPASPCRRGGDLGSGGLRRYDPDLQIQQLKYSSGDRSSHALIGAGGERTACSAEMGTTRCRVAPGTMPCRAPPATTRWTVGAGADRMAGGNGNDLYRVDDLKDVVDEIYCSGTDTVESSISFSLSGTQVRGDVENLTLTGGANIDGTGNAQNNVIIGNVGNNQLNGLEGNDTLSGGGGRDNDRWRWGE